MWFGIFLYAGLYLSTSSALTISQINGPSFRSPYEGKSVSDVTGLVTAIGPSGFFLRDTTPDTDIRTSSSIYVYTSSATDIISNIETGDVITIDARVTEYRSSKDYLYLTELSSPTNLQKISSGNEVSPIVLGEDRIPPTLQFSSLDGGDIFAVPNNQSLVSVANATLAPSDYGLDFWESLSGELVTVLNPVALGLPNSYGEVWVRGDWAVTGENSRGGLTITSESAGIDANPEAITIGEPLDGSSNDATKLGDSLATITGVVTYAYGYYRILPLTGLSVESNAVPLSPSSTTLVSVSGCDAITFGSYNVENLAPTSAHLPSVAAHIVDYLNTPDLMFLQEIQDNDGPTNSGTVSANVTLQNLADAIESLSGVEYAFTDIAPVDGQDGGEPGGNIRVAYFYKPSLLSLKDPNPGSSTDANEVLSGPALKFNPGRIDPSNTAWTNSRKPLVAEFETADGGSVFVINVHFGSKGGSSSIMGDARPPVNGGVDDRQLQAEAVASFISQILAEDSAANIIAAGDFNEFMFVEPMKAFEGVLYDLDDVVGIPPQERYTYLYDMNSQQLDHMLISEALRESAEYEHIHANTWSTEDSQVSDHDPSVARFNICKY